MNGTYRKIVVGSDYLNAMVLKEGQLVMGQRATIHAIVKREDVNRWFVYIKSTSSEEVFEWKSFPDSIVSTENFIDLS
jgi:hypothetical protein